MNPCELSATISAISIAISNSIPNDDELALLGAIFTQIGDSLTVVSISRSLSDKQKT